MSEPFNFSGTKILYLFLSLCIGLAMGIGVYTFIYAKGASYLSDDPTACTNCHIMSEQYDGWVKSSHHAVANCNACHTPHTLVGKYKTKISNGFHHSLAFTTGDFKDNIQIKPHNKQIVEVNCRVCHQDMVSNIDGPHQKQSGMSCLQCHSAVGHP